MVETKRKQSIRNFSTVMSKARRTILGSLDLNKNSTDSAERKETKSRSITRSSHSRSSSTSSRGSKSSSSSSSGKSSTKRKIPKSSSSRKTKKSRLRDQEKPSTPKDILGMMSPQMDRRDHSFPQCATDYVQDIYEVLREKEVKARPRPDYFDHQNDLQAPMRHILIDWLIDVHYKFKLHPETLYLAVGMIDRVLTQKQISRNKLQLLGIGALLLAAKYEEIYPPHMRKCLEICANAYTKTELIAMETCILNCLHWELGCVTPYQFMQRFLKCVEHNQSKENYLQIAYLVHYFCEMSLLDVEFVKFLPSEIAASACILAQAVHFERVDKKNSLWNSQMQYYSRYQLDQLKPCLETFQKRARLEQKETKLKNLGRKWGRSSRQFVSTFAPQICEKLSL